jgi:hypothetical protein
MNLRETIANGIIGIGIAVGELMGLKQVVELSDHSIECGMEPVDKDRRAWDTSLYKNGNVFLSNYANPIKPRVNHNTELENPDSVYVDEGEPDERTQPATPKQEHHGLEPEQEGPQEPPQETPSGERELTHREANDTDAHVGLISSSRYRDYMRQDLISQLLNPQEAWQTIVYALLAVGALQFLTIIVTLWATGSFA